MENKTLLSLLRKLDERAGHLSLSQYVRIADTMANLAIGEKSLVFGCGEDTSLWDGIARGHVLFVEDDPQWLDRGKSMGVDVMFHRYLSQINVQSDPPGLPLPLHDIWSLILIDGPRGCTPESPGRQHSIQMAAAAKIHPRGHIFLHDYNRSWEMECAHTYLGKPDEVMPGKGLNDLAIWRR